MDAINVASAFNAIRKHLIRKISLFYILIFVFRSARRFLLLHTHTHYLLLTQTTALALALALAPLPFIVNQMWHILWNIASVSMKQVQLHANPTVKNVWRTEWAANDTHQTSKHWSGVCVCVWFDLTKHTKLKSANTPRLTNYLFNYAYAPWCGYPGVLLFLCSSPFFRECVSLWIFFRFACDTNHCNLWNFIEFMPIMNYCYDFFLQMNRTHLRVTYAHNPTNWISRCAKSPHKSIRIHANCLHNTDLYDLHWSTDVLHYRGYVYFVITLCRFGSSLTSIS